MVRQRDIRFQLHIAGRAPVRQKEQPMERLGGGNMPGLVRDSRNPVPQEQRDSWEDEMRESDTFKETDSVLKARTVCLQVRNV